MQVHWVRWAAALVALWLVARYSDASVLLYRVLLWLAARPGNWDAFRDPISGRTDALLTLVTFFMMIPIGLFILTLVLVFVLIVLLLLTDPLLRTLSMPSWVCVPIVLIGAVVAAYIGRALWLPDCLYVLGLVAQAGLVYFSAVPPVPH